MALILVLIALRGDVNVAYQGDEFTALVAGQGKFTSIELKGYSHGALSVISRKLLNNVDINVTNFLDKQDGWGVCRVLGERIACWNGLQLRTT